MPSRANWKKGDTALVKEGWDMAGTLFPVLGPAVFSKQWWVPIIDIEESEDPTFFKEAGLYKVYNKNKDIAGERGVQNENTDTTKS